MTSGRQRHLAPQPVDIRLIIHEAQTRWLRPAEVCEILHNYKLHNFKLNPVPPTTPPSGSLFLFDRKALRYFRKDGHNWRKKRDGKTVREAHERLKAGSVDVLHCYYAHGEDNPNFQRRAYWMLDPAHEHIVLVHYREVTEGNRCGIRNVHDYDRATATTSTMQFPQAASFGTTNMSSVNSHSLASPETVDMHGPSHSPELEEAESAEPDELEEMVSEIGGGDHAGLQTSLLEQIADSPQMPITHRPSTEAPWQANFNNTASTTFRTSNGVGADPHISSAAFPPQREFKPVLSLQRPPQQVPQHFPSPNLTRSGPISSLSRIADMLDSPGPSPNNLSSSNALDLNGWSKLLEHDRGSSASSWRDMFTQSTTPESRRNLLHGAGLQSGPGQSPLGQGVPTMGAPPTPKGKGIADALSPKNLGRVPQSALEADLRNVSERIVLKEAEQKQHQAQRSRWQTGQSLQPDTSLTEVPNENRQVQSTQQMFVEPDTLSAVVGGARTQQQVWQEKLWQPPFQQACVQSVNPYEQQGQLDSRHHLAGLRVAPPPPNQNTSLLPENTGNFSPTVESLIDDVRHDVENNDTEVIENLKKLGSFGKIDSFGKMDSFGRWMNTAYDISEIPTTSGSSGSLWNLGYNEEPMPGVPQHMDESLSPAVSLSEQKYNIVDFSPEWGSPGEDTKILITGSFVKPPRETNHKWCCMFGVVEVPAELICEGSLRCKAPPQEPGTVPFYVTCGDRQACSQVREFEYRASTAQPRQLMDLNAAGSQSEADPWKELLLKIRLSRMLLGHESSISNREGNKVQKIDEKDDDPWRQLESVVLAQDRPMAEVKELLFQEVMRHKLEEWLQAKSSLEDGRGPRVLDDRGQGVPHFLAALGYDWSIPLVFTSPDVPINFRDDAGWTALHWAAKYGREKMVVDLLDNGAEPGLSSDPSRSCPRGETAADVAKAGDHGGIAAFLAERSLTERLSGLTLNDSNVILGEIEKMTAEHEGEKMVAQLARRISIVRSIREQEDQEKLQVSLEAVRASAHKAALLQSAFRQFSFRRRAQLEAEDSYEYGLTHAEMSNLLAARRIQQAYRGHNQKKAKQQLAATRIQQKYRGWKGRKDFQAMRQRVIKIQAHVRGRLVRSKYQRIVWSVSIVEKLVLRWLRKRRGLRGFHPANGLEETADDIEDLTKDGREKQKVEVQKDVDKVYSMARQKSDREQYSRLVEESRRSASKAELNEALAGTSDYMERDL